MSCGGRGIGWAESGGGLCVTRRGSRGVGVRGGVRGAMAWDSVSRERRVGVQGNARGIALLFETAGDEAQVRARPIAWQPTAHGFHFDVSSPDGWRTLRDDLLRPRDWDGGVTGADIDYPGSDTHANRVVFGTESIDTPGRVTLHSAVRGGTVVRTRTGGYEL
ncbi:type II secretion system protein GspH [Burkholderia contaminans]|nr:type II secretion system protein GspH [Burkholderia contaminans]